MPTNIAVFRARLLDERAAVQAQIAAIDVAEERARFESAETNFVTAQRAFARAQTRWGLVSEKLTRLAVLDEQIDIVTP